MKLPTMLLPVFKPSHEPPVCPLHSRNASLRKAPSLPEGVKAVQSMENNMIGLGLR